ncbi:hypothetical protein bcgnr5372_45770 [Bacillus luti]|nr:hypothetical protein [Bacillus cereus]HDR8329667.1 hypothetical protein [Bacillus cereus]HDR8337049.1 hypothetical protein [Bacillus cereus]
MYPNRITLQIKDFKNIVALIEKNDNTKLQIIKNELYNTISMEGEDGSTKLYLKSLQDGSLVVARISLEVQRTGTGSILFKILKEYAIGKGFEKLIVEAVLTDTMRNFCIKQGFEPNEHFGTYIQGKFYGNYELDLSNN